MSDYIHLHNHSHYSLLDAACTPEQLIAAAGEDNQNAIALTDHGVMFGCFEFYKKAKKAGIKPIIGCEVYLAVGSRFETTARKKGVKTRNYYHLLLLAKNNIGYSNLMKLCTLGHTEGFYYKPRIDRDILMQYKEGLIALSACLSGVINAPLLEDDYPAAKANAIWFKQQFGDDFYIELQNHGLPQDEKIMTQAPKLAEELGIKLICSNDCHYIRKDEAVAHNVLLNIRDVSSANSGTTNIYDLRYQVPEMYFKTQAMMKELFKDYPEAIDNTQEVAEKCSVELQSEPLMPQFPIPADSNAKSLEEYLEQLTYAGLEKRYTNLTKDILDRTAFELNVIKGMGYAGYFLIVQDFISAARDRGVSVGPGRGSAAGSIVAYALGIINVDPLKYDLLFERFLNPDRVSMPDIDVDFSDNKRNVVIEYVKQKYGEESVAQIITFGTLSTRAVLKDVGRVLGVNHRLINDITSKIPVFQGKVTPLSDALKLPELRWLSETKDAKLKEVVNYALTLEGLARNSSIHAAGVIIAPGPVSNYVPLYKSSDGELATQYTMKDIEDAGLLKMDILGLRTLSIIENTLEQIQLLQGVTVDLDSLDLGDPLVYSMIGRGKTLAVFQFESDKMQEYLAKLQPSNLEDLIAMNALYRPGPMDNIPDFIDRKQGNQEISYLHPLMEKSLKTTYGIIVYQEQVMQLVRDLAGFTLAQSDIMRRAMGKKDHMTMLNLKQQFIEGATQNGLTSELSGEIFDLIFKFASYGFNKSHSCAYAYLAFQTAWLKAHYTAEFLAANMTAEINDQDKIVQLIREAKDFDIEVEAPDVNRSYAIFSAYDSNSIVFGLAGVKGVGIAAVEAIVEARKNGNFTSLFDFARRVDAKHINKRLLEALIQAGAFDSMNNGHRAQLFAAVDAAVEYSRALQSSANSSMDSLFGGSADTIALSEPLLHESMRWSDAERLRREKDVANFYLTGHPAQSYLAHIRSFSTFRLNTDRPSYYNGKYARLCGMLTDIRTRLDKKERSIGFAKLEDLSGSAEVIVWGDCYATFGEFLQSDTVVIVKGKIEYTQDRLKIIAEEIYPIEYAAEQYAKGYSITLQYDKDSHNTDSILMKMQDLNRLVNSDVKPCTVLFTLHDSKHRPISRFYSSSVHLPLNQETFLKISRILGENKVLFEIN